MNPGGRAARRGVLAGITLALLVQAAHADVLVGLAPGDARVTDARRSIAIGPSGEVYEPAGGAWVRRKRIATATRLARVGRAGRWVVAQGQGVVYRLAPNGWSALRLAQTEGATITEGLDAVGVVGRRIYSLERLHHGQPAKLGEAPAPVRAVGAGKTIVVATARGLFRLGRKPVKLPAVRGAVRLVGDRWALARGAAIDLRSRTSTRLPAGWTVAATTLAGNDLVAVARRRRSLELWRLGAKLVRTPIPGASGRPVGVVVDRRARVVIALADGTLLVRDKDAWTTTEVREELPAPRPGPGPATSS